jgi:hypothetical protein
VCIIKERIAVSRHFQSPYNNQNWFQPTGFSSVWFGSVQFRLFYIKNKKQYCFFGLFFGFSDGIGFGSLWFIFN